MDIELVHGLYILEKVPSLEDTISHSTRNTVVSKHYHVSNRTIVLVEPTVDCCADKPIFYLQDIIWLVVWNIWIIFPYIWHNNPNWLSYCFQRGRYTTNQLCNSYNLRSALYVFLISCYPHLSFTNTGLSENRVSLNPSVRHHVSIKSGDNGEESISNCQTHPIFCIFIMQKPWHPHFCLEKTIHLSGWNPPWINLSSRWPFPRSAAALPWDAPGT